MMGAVIVTVFVILAVAMCIFILFGNTRMSSPGFKMFFFMSAAVYLSGTLFVGALYVFKGIRYLPFLLTAEISMLFVFVVTILVLLNMTKEKDND